MKDIINKFKSKIFSLYLNNLKKLTDSFIEQTTFQLRIRYRKQDKNSNIKKQKY